MIENKRYVVESFPPEWANKHFSEVDYLAWLNEKLKEGKVLCAFVPLPNGMFQKALFICEV